MSPTNKVTIPCTSDEACLELCFEPNQRLVNVVRDFVSRFYEQILVDADTSARVAIATQELLENGARYSVDGSTVMRIAVSKAAGLTSVRICTRNRTAPLHVVAVRQAIDELAGADPLTHYLKLMQRTATRADGSGLGLGRIRAEAEMDLRYIIQGDWVTILAETAIHGEHA